MPIDSAVPTDVHGITDNRRGIGGLCVLYSVGGTHFRARLRAVTAADTETVARGDAYTMFEWSEVETPTEDAEAVASFDLSHVPRVVRNQVPGVVQVADGGPTA